MNTKKSISDNHKKKLETVLSVVLPVLVFIGMVAYLVFYLLNHSPLVLTNDSFYRQALVSSEQSVPLVTHDISGLYVYLLHIMLLVFGNTPFGGIVLQIALFFICLLLLYIGMQAYTSSIPAAVSMALFGFLAVYLQYVFSLTPELFFMTFCLLGFCFTGIIYRAIKRHKARLASRHVETNVDKDDKKDKEKEKQDKEEQEKEKPDKEKQEKEEQDKEKPDKEEQATPAPSEPLPNPLPVPKKKSRPTMDFGYQVKEADMKFDIEVKDGDDFDK